MNFFLLLQVVLGRRKHTDPTYKSAQQAHFLEQVEIFHKISSLQDITFDKIPIFTRQQISKDSKSYKTLVSKSEGVTLSKINVGVA